MAWGSGGYEGPDDGKSSPDNPKSRNTNNPIEGYGWCSHARSRTDLTWSSISLAGILLYFERSSLHPGVGGRFSRGR